MSSWLVLQHGPEEIVIALGGVQVDALRTVLAPINTPPAEPETAACLVPVTEKM